MIMLLTNLLENTVFSHRGIIICFFSEEKKTEPWTIAHQVKFLYTLLGRKVVKGSEVAHATDSEMGCSPIFGTTFSPIHP